MAERPTFRRTTHSDLPAVLAILALAGEHLHRVQGLSHWYPFPSLDVMAPRLRGRDVYVAEVGDLAVGTFNVSSLPEDYHDLSQWPDGAVPAAYLSGLGVLPSHWGMGIGTAMVTEARRLARASGHTRLRFDAVAANERLVAWYRSLGFTETGSVDVGVFTVTCFEGRL